MGSGQMSGPPPFGPRGALFVIFALALVTQTAVAASSSDTRHKRQDPGGIQVDADDLPWGDAEETVEEIDAEIPVVHAGRRAAVTVASAGTMASPDSPAEEKNQFMRRAGRSTASAQPGVLQEEGEQLVSKEGQEQDQEQEEEQEDGAETESDAQEEAADVAAGNDRRRRRSRRRWFANAVEPGRRRRRNRRRASLPPWQCHLFDYEGVSGITAAMCKDNPIHGGYEYAWTRGEGLCGACWCCKRSLWEQWMCHEYDTSKAQDHLWCRENPQEDGFAYKYFEGDGTCGDCYCCKRPLINQTCHHTACTNTQVLKADAGQRVCGGERCNNKTDPEECCDERAFCEADVCGESHELRTNVSKTRCAGKSCYGYTDRDLCCEPRSVCDKTACTVNYVLKVEANGTLTSPPLYCRGSKCHRSDEARCCDPREICNENACDRDYFYLNKFEDDGIRCKTKYCNIPDDQGTCCGERAMCDTALCTVNFTMKIEGFPRCRKGKCAMLPPPPPSPLASAWAVQQYVDDVKLCCDERAMCNWNACSVNHEEEDKKKKRASLRESSVELLQMKEVRTTKVCRWKLRRGDYVKEGHKAKEPECYDTLKEAKQKCTGSKDCFAVSTQTNICGGKFRVTHGGPTFKKLKRWKKFGLKSFECKQSGSRLRQAANAVKHAKFCQGIGTDIKCPSDKQIDIIDAKVKCCGSTCPADSGADCAEKPGRVDDRSAFVKHVCNGHPVCRLGLWGSIQPGATEISDKDPCNSHSKKATISYSCKKSKPKRFYKSKDGKWHAVADDPNITEKYIYMLNPEAAKTSRCVGKECSVEEEFDLDTCCEPALRCEKHACGKWHLLKKDAHERRCKDMMNGCNASIDEEECCDERPVCDEDACSSNYTLKTNLEDLRCKDAACTHNDTKHCCNERMICNKNACEAGASLKPNATLHKWRCLGAFCSHVDSGLCCDKAATCDAEVCEDARRQSKGRKEWVLKVGFGGLVTCKGTKCKVTECCEITRKGKECDQAACDADYNVLKPGGAALKCVKKKKCIPGLDAQHCCEPAGNITSDMSADVRTGKDEGNKSGAAPVGFLPFVLILAWVVASFA